MIIKFCFFPREKLYYSLVDFQKLLFTHSWTVIVASADSQGQPSIQVMTIAIKKKSVIDIYGRPRYITILWAIYRLNLRLFPS